MGYGASGSTEQHPRPCPPSPLLSLLIYRSYVFLFLAVLHSIVGPELQGQEVVVWFDRGGRETFPLPREVGKWKLAGKQVSSEQPS